MDQEKKRPSEQLSQPVYVLPPDYFPGYEEDEVNLTDYILVLWRKRFLIVGMTALLGAAAFLVSILLPKTYEATATLLVQPPPFTTELKQPPLSVETYNSIVGSGYIQNALKEQLIKDGVVKEGEGIGILDTAIYASKIRDAAYSPIVDLKVQSSSPDKAQIIANTWADVFIRENSALAERGSQGTFTFIEKQYSVTEENLDKQEQSLKDRQDHYAASLLSLTESWTERILNYAKESARIASEFQIETDRVVNEFRNETARLIDESRKETERLVQAFDSEWQPDFHEEQLTALQEKQADLDGKKYTVDLDIEAKRKRLEQLKEQFSTQPQFVVISKAITDDAMWERLGRDSSGGLPKELEQLRIRSESVNPIYESLLQQIIDTQVEYESLASQQSYMAGQLETLKGEIQTSASDLSRVQTDRFALVSSRDLVLATLRGDRETGLKALGTARAVGLANLQAERATGKALMEASRDKAIKDLERQRDFEVASLTRDRDTSEETFKVLAPKFEAAQLAKAEEEPDIRIGAYAALPGGPVRPRPMMNTAIALVVGFMLAVMVAFGSEFVQKAIKSGKV